VHKNPLLYSDPSELEEPIVADKPKQSRSWVFYFIIVANSLLVVFVLGVLWFLFLKSPDTQVKNLSERFFGAFTTPHHIEDTKGASSKQDLPDTLSEQTSSPQQDEKPQTSLKQAYEQTSKTELVPALVKDSTLNITQSSSQQETKATTLTQPSQTSPNNTDSHHKGAVETASEHHTPQPQEATEPARVPNAARETQIPQGNTVNTQVDQILETLRHQQDEKNQNTASDVLHESKTSPSNIPHQLIEKQLEALIETEQLKFDANTLLQHANELDKEIRIDQRLSILPIKAV